MKKLLIIALLFASCTDYRKNIILNKSIIQENPYFSNYTFSTFESFEYVKFVDSTSRYNIGDSVNKYPKH
jgi:hypothetical protein